MNQQSGLITEKEYSIELRRYSKKILGYRVFTSDLSKYFVLNETYPLEDLDIVLDELKIISDKYIQHGFVMLLEDGSVYTDPRLLYDRKSGRYTFKSENNVIIPFHAHKYYQEALKRKRGFTK